LALPAPRRVALPAPGVQSARALTTARAQAARADRLFRWERFVETFLPLERQYMKRLAGRGQFFFQLRKEVLGHLEEVVGARGFTARARTIEDDVARILFESTNAERELRALSRPFFERAITTGAEGAAASIGAEVIGLDGPDAQAFLALKDIKVTRVTDTLAEDLRFELFDGLQADENLTDLAARVRGVFNQYSRTGATATASRARTIARTEISQGVNGARFIEFRGQGVERHAWLSANDEVVRSPARGNLFDHDITGQERLMGQPFENGLLFPNDPGWTGDAANVVNCRCTTEAVVDPSVTKPTP